MKIIPGKIIRSISETEYDDFNNERIIKLTECLPSVLNLLFQIEKRDTGV